MLFNVQIAMVVDAIDDFQTEIIALGHCRLRTPRWISQAARVVDAAVNVTSREE